VWWLASIIGLESGLIDHIDNIQSRDEANRSIEKDRDLREVSVRPRDIQEDPRSSIHPDIVHPDSRAQIQDPDSDISSLDIEDIRQEELIENTEKFISPSRKERKADTRRNSSNAIRAPGSGKSLNR
jgi:hypothetical protein